MNEKIYGTDLYFDSFVINFEYSEIGKGNQKNLAFPYRIYSEKISPENAIKFETFKTNPEKFVEKESETVLGLSRDLYIERAKEFIEIINDPVQRQEMGIRSNYGNAITIHTPQKGEVYTIMVNGTGGLKVKKSVDNFLE